MPSPEEQLSRYKVLMEMARCFGRAMDLQTLIDEILDRSQQVMHAEACTLFLPDRRTGDLLLHSTDPKIRTLPEPLRLPPGKGIAGAVFQTRQPINIKEPKTDPRFFQGIAQRVGFETRAMLTIPLLDGANCAGVLQALNPIGRECFDDQDEEVFEGFGGLIANALVRIESERRELELARSRQELVVAREIQESFLPAAVQEFPGGEVRIEYFPASAVGGDFCSVHRVGDDRLLLGLGDVTGKGIPAALTMARATAMIKALVPQLDRNLGKWVSELNEHLVQDLQAGRFIGMTFLLTDATAETLQICAAGQFAPIHYDGQHWKVFAAANHLPLGIAPAVNYRATTAPLKRGESWLLLSDGIPEARNRQGEDFTLPRVEQLLDQTEAAARTLQPFVAAWKEFVGDAPTHDDASLLLLNWRGPRPPATFETQCCLETLCQGRSFVENWAAFAGFDDVAIGQIVLACDEAVTNIFRHGYHSQPGPLTITAEAADGVLSLTIADHAAPVDPGKLRGRELTDLRPGGLGTFIINQVFDEVRYEPTAQGTSLHLRKKVAAPAG